MDTLPLELIHQIVTYITHDRKQRILLACVSRRFQMAIELFTFRSIKIKSFDLWQFNNFFRYPHRRNSLRRLQYGIRLPMYTSNSAKRFESKRAKRINDEVFTNAIVGLFRILSSWNYDDSPDPAPADGAGLKQSYNYGAGIDVHICEIYSNSDLSYAQEQNFENKEEESKVLKEARYKHSYLKLVPVPSFEIASVAFQNKAGRLQEIDIEGIITALPLVERVTKFTVALYPSSERKIEPAIVMMLAAKMPNLKNLSMHNMRDNETRFMEIRQRLRLEFGQSLLKLCNMNYLANLYSFELHLVSPDPSNHKYCAPALHPSHPTTDFLSLGLHALSRLPSIKRLQLGIIGSSRISISPSLFWPSAIEDNDLSPSWPSLEHFEIVVSPVTSAGTWYITRDPSIQCFYPSSAVKLSSTMIYSSESDAEGEDSYSDRSITPPPPSHRLTCPSADFQPSTGADAAHPRREGRLGGHLPIHPFRTMLDPETFNPLISAITKMIAIARQQKLAQMVFSLDLGSVIWKGADHDRFTYDNVHGREGRIDFELYFFRSGVKELQDLLNQEHIQHRDRIIIRTRKELKWDVLVDSHEGVLKALRQAVGENGIVRMDTAE